MGILMISYAWNLEKQKFEKNINVYLCEMTYVHAEYKLEKKTGPRLEVLIKTITRETIKLSLLNPNSHT